MFPGKRVLVAIGVALATGGLVAIAFGQTVVPMQITATVKVTPDKAGTPSHPRGIEIDARATITAQDGTTTPLMPRSIDVWLPKGWGYDGAGHPTCALTVLTSRGPTGCPPRSIIGRGELGHHLEGDGDTTFSHRNLTIINGGLNRVYLWVVLSDPARVHGAVVGTIAKLNSSQWSYRLHVAIPRGLQVVASIPVAVTFFTMRVRSSTWIVTTNCPHDHRWRYHLKMIYTSGQVADTGGSVICRRSSSPERG